MKWILACLALALTAPAPAAPAIDFSKPPQAKYSDLYRYLSLQVRRALTETVTVWPIRLVGRAAEIADNATFYEAELILKPFEFQDLSFEKGEFYLKNLRVDKEAFRRWEMKMLDYRETKSRLIFTLRSLEKKLAKAHPGLKLRSNAQERAVELSGRGRFLLLGASYEAKAGLRWDEGAKKLFFEPREVRWAGFKVPRVLWWLGSRAVPREPILDLSACWIPLNFQETYVGWDWVNLSTDW